MTIPMPNDKQLGGTVIASVHYREADDDLPNDRYTLVVLMPEAPFYKVAVVVDHDGELTEEWTEIHHNIGPAIAGGGEGSEQRRALSDNPEWGYRDMGGDW